MSLILDVKVFIESLTKNINFEVNLSLFLSMSKSGGSVERFHKYLLVR